MTPRPDAPRPLDSLPGIWRADAATLRKMRADEKADVLEYCADELTAVLADTSDDDEEVTVAEFAAMHHRAASTVRGWCKTGKILSRSVGREYVIRRGEPCPKLSAA